MIYKTLQIRKIKQSIHTSSLRLDFSAFKFAISNFISSFVCLSFSIDVSNSLTCVKFSSCFLCLSLISFFNFTIIALSFSFLLSKSVFSFLNDTIKERRRNFCITNLTRKHTPEPIKVPQYLRQEQPVSLTTFFSGYR